MPMKLHYFDVKGKAEAIRIAAHVAGLPLEDVRIARDAWEKVKPTMPLGQVPVLELEDGTKIPESLAILAYVASVGKLQPTNPKDLGLATAVVVFVEELFMNARDLWKASDAERPAVVERVTPLLVEAFKRYNTLVKHAGGKDGHVVGSTMTIADIVVYRIVDAFLTGEFFGINIDQAHYPQMKAVYDKMLTNPKIKEYRAKHNQ